MSAVEAVQTTKATPSTTPSAMVLQRKCACGGSAGLSGECEECKTNKLLGKPLQKKLAISEPGDEYEQEADRVAEQVLRMPANHMSGHHNIQRPSVQRQTGEDGAGMMEAPSIVHEVLNSPGQPLDAATRAYFEPRFGQDFNRVRVHTDARAEESTKSVGALAYTVGPNVVFDTDRYKPQTEMGRQLLAHELTHVVQQGNGAASPLILRRTVHGPGTPTNCHNWTIPLPPWIAGSIAHSQINSELGIMPHSIPRASKMGGLLTGVPNPPAITPLGFADLWQPFGRVNVAEIKSTATGSTVAATEARHYLLRHTECLTRQSTGVGDSWDASYLADAGAVPGGLMDLSSRTGPDLNLGLFAGDPGKTLHIEADSSGAVVYWCVGSGITGSPLWLPVLKKLLDDLKKKLNDAKRPLQEAYARAVRAIVEFGKALPAILRVLFMILLILAFIALFVVAIACLLSATVTLGGTSACSVGALMGAAATASALLIIIGLPAPDLPEATANLYKSLQPSSIVGEPESGADYERDADNTSDAVLPPSSAAARIASYNPGSAFLSALRPIGDRLSDPIALARSVAGSSHSLPNDAIARLNTAIEALEAMGDATTSGMLRSAIQSSGLDRPGALAELDNDSLDEALALLDSGVPGDGPSESGSAEEANV